MNSRLMTLLLTTLILWFGLPNPGNAQDDPPLCAGTYFGGSGADGWADVPVVEAADGTLYIAASTQSINLPMPGGGFDTTSNGNWDIFVAHFDANMSQLLHATYLGGSAIDAAWPGVGLVLGADGSVYVTSTSVSDDYPTTEGAYSQSSAGIYDIVISRLSSDLSELMASTYLGGSATEDFPKLALHPSGDILMICCTISSNFPTTPNAFRTYRRGGKELALARLSPDLGTLVAGTYLGSSVNDWPEAVVTYGEDEIFLTGWTQSTSFPTTDGAFMETASGGNYQAFVSCLSADLTTLVASTLISGNSWEFGYDVVVDENGKVYACGHTASTNFPGADSGYQGNYNGIGGAGSGDDMFVVRLDHGLTTLEASTYIGGEQWENATELQLVPGGIIVGGTTSSPDYPTTVGAFRTTIDPGASTYTRSMALVNLDRDLVQLQAGTFMGGTGIDNLGGLLLNQEGNLVVGGSTSSYNFPVANQAYNNVFAGGSFDWGGDVILAMLDTELSVPELAPAPEIPVKTDLILEGAIPNPFNPQTEVAFSLGEVSRVKVDVHDLAGRLVATLADREFSAGSHRIVWRGRDATGRSMPSGTYLVSFSHKSEHQCLKLVLGK